jgi:S1-C subfamily serine protease
MNRMTYRLLLALGFFSGFPLAATAQDRPRAFTVPFSRGRIGVVVMTDADARADKIGARVEAVSPGGPADKAGLKAGDVITVFNGVALGGAAAADDDASGPGLKLVRLAHALDPGDTVRIAYRRGDDTRKATLVAEEVENPLGMGLPRPGLPIEPPDVRWRVEGDLPGVMLWSPWFDLDLTSLNPDLAEYFGTEDGVLVVRASRDASLPLKGGDVIVAIDGRKATSPSHAMRILRSYAAGDSVRIDILRKQKRQTVTSVVPDREGLLRERRTPRAPSGPSGERT